jgi:hypothetical protein
VEGKKKDDQTETPLARRLRQLSETSKRVVMCRLPENERVELGSPTRILLNDYVERIRDHSMSVKFRGKQILIANHEWFWTEVEGRRVPFAAIRAVRAAQQLESKPAFIALSEALSKLTVPQLMQLSKDYPFVGGFRQWYDLFVLSTRNRNVRSGLVSQRGSSAATILSLLPESELARTLQSGEAAAVRITESSDPMQGWRRLMVEMLSATGAKVGGGGVRWSTERGTLGQGGWGKVELLK